MLGITRIYFHFFFFFYLPKKKFFFILVLLVDPYDVLLFKFISQIVYVNILNIFQYDFLEIFFSYYFSPLFIPTFFLFLLNNCQIIRLTKKKKSFGILFLLIFFYSFFLLLLFKRFHLAFGMHLIRNVTHVHIYKLTKQKKKYEEKQLKSNKILSSIKQK